MDIPKIIATAGKNNKKPLIEAMAKSVEGQINNKKEALNVYMDLDIGLKEIRFQAFPYQAGCENRFHYFGANPSAAKQVYAVRSANDFLKYWTGSTKGIFQNMLDGYLNDGELKDELSAAREAGLFDETGPKNLKQKDGSPAVFQIVGKEFQIEGQKAGAEAVLASLLGTGSGQQIMLVIPRIINGTKTCVISQHEDYTAAVAKTFEIPGGSRGVCHICGAEKPNINTLEYSTKFIRDGISKIFITKKINYARDFDKKKHQDNYAICWDCYQNILHGEKMVMQDCITSISRQPCLFLFEGLTKEIDYSEVPKLKDDIDLIFNPKDSEKWFDDFDNAMEDLKINDLFEFHMIFYDRNPGKSFSVKKTIESVSNIRFVQVNEAFAQTTKILKEDLPHFSLGKLYYMYPLRTDTHGKLINGKGLLDLYNSILKGEPLSRASVFALAREAIERGTNELNSSQIRNYNNLCDLPWLKQKYPQNTQDIYTKRIVALYTAFFHALQKLNLLNKEVWSMDVKSNEAVPDCFADVEEYLQRIGYHDLQKGAFYIGILVHYVGYLQYKQDHKTKPILDKINYGGMTGGAMVMLYQELINKTRQYKRYASLSYCELLISQIQKFLPDKHSLNQLSPDENLFYLMAGYGFEVGRKYKKQDAETIKEDKNDDKE